MILASLVLAATFTRTMERVATLDPAFSQSVYDSRVVQLLYEPLLKVDYLARPYKLTAGYCELPEVSPDGLVYTFRTLHGPAKDVVASIERLRDPDLVSPNSWLLKSVDTIEATDDRTVVFRMKSRCHFFPWLMAMSPASVRRPDGSGTGPFELTKWRKNHEMVFTRKVPEPGKFDTLRYLVIDDLSTQWLMFLKGELDFLGEISKDNWDAVMGKDGNLDPQLVAEGVKLHSIATLDTFYIGINLRDPVLGPNKKLRQALNAAFDYPRWEEYFSKRTAPSDGPVPPGVDGKLVSPFPYAFNLELAKKLVDEAGYPGGIDPKTGRRLTLTLSFGKASTSTREMGELLASFYEKIGIKLELAFQTWDAFLKAVNEGRVQLYNMGWVGDYPDAENFLQLFYSKNVSPGPNHSHYINPEFDRAYDAAMAAPTREERNRNWAICQELVREDCPWIFGHYSKSNSLVRPRVGNYVPSDFPYGQEVNFTVNE